MSWTLEKFGEDVRGNHMSREHAIGANLIRKYQPRVWPLALDLSTSASRFLFSLHLHIVTALPFDRISQISLLTAIQQHIRPLYPCPEDVDFGRFHDTLDHLLPCPCFESPWVFLERPRSSSENHDLQNSLSVAEICTSTAWP